jgi:hypothetical protein
MNPVHAARILGSFRLRSAMGLSTLAFILLSATNSFAISSKTLITMTGASAGDWLGVTVASAGDVNGDGYPDVIVGAPYSNGTGRAYVFFGGPAADGVADLTLTGASSGDFFGISVASAGDVNGDGYADVIVGAENAGAGRAYVYYGGPGADAVADLTLVGATSGDHFGHSVSSAGDVNGDGHADVIVGAEFASGTGRAYVYYGGPGADSVADVTLTGAAADDRFASSVGSVGDVNGDGSADVIVGAKFNDAGGLDAGRAYIFYGGPGIDAVPDLTLTGASAGANFGYSVASAGDVNGDGHPDIIVGAPSDGGTGRAYIYYGGAALDAIADVTLTGFETGGFFGVSVSSAGDMDADGYGDVLVGADLSDGNTGTDSGRAYVYFGGVSADTTPDLTLAGAAAHDLFGVSVSSAGDINGDGHSDVIVGAYQNDADGNAIDAGRAYVISLTLPDLANSFYVPQSGTVASPAEGATAVRNFFTCPNNDGSALPNNARIKLVIKDSAGVPIANIAASDINVRFNGGTTAQGFTGPDADSVIANLQYNPLAVCPDVRRLNADAPSDANGVAYLTFKGALPGNPGVAVRDSTRKWGHYDTELPVYVLGVRLQGRFTSLLGNGSYILELKNLDFVDGLTTVKDKGELVNSLDRTPMQAHQGQLDSANALNWWMDMNSDGIVNSLDLNLLNAHINHNCNTPGR